MKCQSVNNADRTNVTATNCMESVVQDLVTPYLRLQFVNPTLHYDLKYAIASLLGKDIREMPQEEF